MFPIILHTLYIKLNSQPLLTKIDLEFNSTKTIFENIIIQAFNVTI